MMPMTDMDQLMKYVTQVYPEEALDDGMGPMLLRPQAFNSRAISIQSPMQVSAVNNLFNRAGGNMRASGMVLDRSEGNGVRKNLGW